MSHTPDTHTGAKDPDIIDESQKVFRTLKTVLVVMAAIFLLSFLGSWVKSCSSERKERNAREAVEEAADRAAMTKAAAERAAAKEAEKRLSTDPEYPDQGEGFPTKDVPLKCWLDPRKTYTRPSGPARYCFEGVPDMCFEDTAGTRVETSSKWQAMPDGKYLVTPLKSDRIYFRWYL